MQNPATRRQEEAPGGSVVTGARAWLLATGCVGLALVLRLALDPLWTDRLPYILFFLAAVVVMHFTEAGPTVFAIVAGFLLGAWFFVAPRHSLLIGNPVDRFNAVIYFIVCFVLLFHTRRTRRALARERAARVVQGRLAAIIESSDDAIIGNSLDGKIVSWNGGASNLYGYTEAEALGQPITFLATPEGGKELAPLLELVGRGEHIRHLETAQRRKDGELVEISLCVSPVRNSAGEIVGVSTIARDIAERKRAERERERLVAELRRLLGEVKTLSGLLPICAYCKKIRDDKGYWNQIELYIAERSSANFTHSVCPDCASHQYSDFLSGKSPVR
ncbi:MAG TPA: PAS domain S-box protein [Candidatus Baltobacteraceae bacterium]|nr:PAS domain S-box protein [Candidatus Baltobacteraceae bacterium]